MEQTLKIILSLLAFILWFIAIRDIILRRLKYLTFNLVWLVIVIVLPIIGSLAYLFMRKNMNVEKPKKFNPKFNRTISQWVFRLTLNVTKEQVGVNLRYAAGNNGFRCVSFRSGSFSAWHPPAAWIDCKQCDKLMFCKNGILMINPVTIFRWQQWQVNVRFNKTNIVEC